MPKIVSKGLQHMLLNQYERTGEWKYEQLKKHNYLRFWNAAFAPPLLLPFKFDDAPAATTLTGTIKPSSSSPRLIGRAGADAAPVDVTFPLAVCGGGWTNVVTTGFNDIVWLMAI
jgi:hypothetical protein